MLLGWCKTKILIWIDSGSDSIYYSGTSLVRTRRDCQNLFELSEVLDTQRFRKFREKKIWFWSEFNLVKFDCNWSCTCNLSSNIRQETEYEPLVNELVSSRKWSNMLHILLISWYLVIVPVIVIRFLYYSWAMW